MEEMTLRVRELEELAVGRVSLDFLQSVKECYKVFAPIAEAMGIVPHVFRF